MSDLILASSSKYRQMLLDRLQFPFTTSSPAVDEQPRPGEAAEALACRLAQAKAMHISQTNPRAVVIGADQVLALNHQLFGKPGTFEQAVKQLLDLQGQRACFYTALCVRQQSTEFEHISVNLTWVKYRSLSRVEIENYLAKEPATDCAGAFKSEGLGITLAESIESDDPTALIGLPLITLSKQLQACGLGILT